MNPTPQTHVAITSTRRRYLTSYLSRLLGPFESLSDVSFEFSQYRRYLTDLRKTRPIKPKIRRHKLAKCGTFKGGSFRTQFLLLAHFYSDIKTIYT